MDTKADAQADLRLTFEQGGTFDYRRIEDGGRRFRVYDYTRGPRGHGANDRDLETWAASDMMLEFRDAIVRRHDRRVTSAASTRRGSTWAGSRRTWR